jgi:5-(hydroxymethyl)furfural/furfural oxidase
VTEPVIGADDDGADIVIVGGGTAGCVLASRLSADSRVKVLLLEAGTDFGLKEPADIADAFPRAYANPAYFTSDLVASVCHSADVRPYTQARLLGGGSAVMGMWALRGLAADFDGWRDGGALGWSHADLLPAIRRLETDMDFSGDAHGSEGPIPIGRVQRKDWPPFAKGVEAAAAARGFCVGEDMNGSDADGIYPLPISADSDGRASSTRYLDSAIRARPNLRIRGGCLVQRILCDATRKATGVEFVQDRRTCVVRANTIIIAAGAIHSPALLLQSGIGSGKTLARIGVPVVSDVPDVGQNLQNHAFLHLGAFIRAPARQRPGLRNYVTGALRFSSGHDGAAPSDMMISMIARPGVHPGGNSLGLLGIHLYAPFSRGEVGLARDGSGLRTNIDFRLVSDSRDAKRLAVAARLSASLLRDPALAAIVDDPFLVPATAPIRALNAPGMASRLRTLGLGLLASLPRAPRRAFLKRALGGSVFLNDVGHDDFDEAVLSCALPMFHVAGTCAIGRVVGPDLAVAGVQNLFVADASVMPTVPRANTNIPTIIVAEKASELIAAQRR